MSGSGQVNACVSNHLRSTVICTQEHFTRKDPNPATIHLLGRSEISPDAWACVAAHEQFFQEQGYRVLNKPSKCRDVATKDRLLSGLRGQTPEVLLARTQVKHAVDLNPSTHDGPEEDRKHLCRWASILKKLSEEMLCTDNT